MFRSEETNRFVVEELRKEKKQQVDLLVNKLFETSSYSSIESPKNIRRKFGKWLCKKKVEKSIQDFHNIGLLDFDCLDSDLGILSKLAIEILEPAQTTNTNFDKLLEWSYVVGDKQYFLYSWNDSKVQGLIAVDGALMAGILFILQLLDGAQNLTLSVPTLVLYSISFVLLACSIVFCLIHTIPKLNSKMGHGHNLKTMIGINRFVKMQNLLGGKNYFRAEQFYYENVKVLEPKDLFEMNIYQIVGMNTNNIKSHRIIRKAVIATIISISSLIFATVIFAIQNIVL